MYHKQSKTDPYFRKALLEAYGRRCAFCGYPLQPSIMQVDHIIPIKAEKMENDEINAYLDELRINGFDLDHPDYIENYLPVCPTCNQRKGNRYLKVANLRYYHDLASQKASEIISLMDRYKKQGKTALENEDTHYYEFSFKNANGATNQLGRSVDQAITTIKKEKTADVIHKKPSDEIPDDINDKTLLYSVGIKLAYNINKTYYRNVHFVWCTSAFNDPDQPPTSNPQTIANRLLHIVHTKDRHAAETEFERILNGLIRGVEAKKDVGIITDDQKEYLLLHIKNIKEKLEENWSQFAPVIYIIPAAHISDRKNRCEEVPENDCASNTSKEYKIKDLQSNEFEVIFTEDLLTNILKK